MSDGGCYTGPGGQKLFGNGREVSSRRPITADDALMEDSTKKRDRPTNFDRAFQDHLSTWGRNCGAPLRVYTGHLCILLSEAQIEALERLADLIDSLPDQLSVDEIRQAIKDRCQSLERQKRA